MKLSPPSKERSDLDGEFFGKFDSKELFGICDYDAIAFVQHNEEYSLVIIEAILASLSLNELVDLKCYFSFRLVAGQANR